MICNKRFATLLGYKTPQELVKIKKPFIDALVDSSSQHALVNAYGNAMERCVGSSFPITWKTKSGKKVRTQVILVPVMYENHLLALHFIE
jgi:hypothetical protein